jgi:hypothetical protein
MKEKRVDVLLSVASFIQLLFLGFGGAFVSELIKDKSEEGILYWSSFFALIFLICIIYLYSEVLFITKPPQS